MGYSNEYHRILDSTFYFIADDDVKNIDIKSNYKIRDLYSSDEYRPKLLKLFTYKFDKTISSKIVKCISANYTKMDFEIYTCLRELELQNFLKDTDRGLLRLKKIAQFINLENINPTSYLDIGCFNGDITNSIVDKFKLTKDNAFGVDIKNYIKDLDSNMFIFEEYNGINIPFIGERFDLITMFMVLHHISENNLELFLKEVYRVLKPGGIVIIREHGLNPMIHHNTHLLDIMHDYYDNILSSNEVKWKGLFDIEINNYNTAQYWVNQFKKAELYLDDSNKKPEVVTNVVNFDDNMLGNIIISLRKNF
ncbi:MAG: class I SAM-dependent methyltransferase [Cetobacterium sp.]